MYYTVGWKFHTWHAKRFLKKVVFTCVSCVLTWTNGIDRIWPSIKQGIEVEFSKPRYIRRNFLKPLKYLEQKLDHLPKRPKKLLLFLSRNSRPKEHPHRNMFFWLKWKLICFYIDKPFIGIVPNSCSSLTAQKTHIPKWASCLYIWKNRFFSGNLSRILLYVKALQEL